MHFVKNRNRPWAFLSRDFWKYLDYFLAELNGGFCVPKIESNPTSYICLVVLIFVHAPLALMAIPFVILFQFIGLENHVSMIYDEKKKPMANKDNSLTVISCNTCLMPEGLARANNLPFVEERAKQIADLCTSEYYSPTTSDFEMVVTDLPNDIDIICLQEVFNEQAWTILNITLAKAGYNYFLYDPHDQFIKSKTFHFMPIINSGLYIASKYPILNSKFVSYKSAYLEDGLCNKGILMAEIEIDSSRSAVVATTHLQAPTGGNRVKASDARCAQWEMIQSSLDEFKAEILATSERKIVIETLCGDFNTNFINPYDQKCKKNKFYETFLDAHQSELDIGTCIVEESVRLDDIATPEGLKKKVLECDSKYIWSSDDVNEEGECISNGDGKSKLDYIFYRGKLRFEYGQIHTTLASLTDHLLLSATFECES